MSEISCPYCNYTTPYKERHCPNCGVDLALATKLVEDALSTKDYIETTFTPELLVPRLGDFLLKERMITEEELQQALDYQRTQEAHGRATLIGQVLVEQGVIDRRTLDVAVTRQILQLQEVLKEANRELGIRVQERTAALERALDKLYELNQMKAQFVENISHELRTPMTALKGYIELLSSGGFGSIPPKVEEAHKAIHRASQRLERLIEDLIHFSESAKGKPGLNKVTVPVLPLIRRAVAQSAPKANQRDILIDTPISAALPHVLADEDKIAWVLTQLLDNAIKYTPLGGIVTVTARAEEADKVSIAVADAGVGIPPEKLNEVFEAFHQLGGTGTLQPEGIGLGLALVKRIIEAHGSTIKVRSAVGQGSLFAFSLPVALQQAGCTNG